MHSERKQNWERAETVSMESGSKEALFKKGHPVIREIHAIEEILFEEDLEKLPAAAISLKTLFLRKQMDHFHVDSLILKKIAGQVLSILEKLHARGIFPGVIGLNDLYVDMNNSRYGVFLLHPEKFQLLNFPQDYDWYPEDERLFGEHELFGETEQRLADNRLIYKILIAAARGNVKVPPTKNETDYSELFFNILPEEWKQLFLGGEICPYERLKDLLTQSIQAEETFAKAAQDSLQALSQQREQSRASAAQGRAEQTEAESRYALFVILRTELDSSGVMSRLLYLLQDEIETQNRLLGRQCRQAFVFGDGAVCVKPFAAYGADFHCQFAQEIREYSAGEALLIGADLLEQTIVIQEKTAEKEAFEAQPEEKSQALSAEFFLYILADGRIKNDQLFQAALPRLAALKEKGVQMELRMTEDIYCEAIQRLKNVIEEEGSFCFKE